MFEEISKNLYVFYSPNEGGNSYLLTGKKTVLIDTSLGKNASHMKDSLRVLGFSPGDIEGVGHTHGHVDHFEADFLFKNAEISMHEYDAQYVNTKHEMFTCSKALGAEKFPKITAFLKPISTIKFEPFSLQIIPTPGHTKGSVCFYDKAQKLLFSGDTLFKGSCGRFDLVSGSKKDMISSLKKLSKLEFNTLLPGHGQILKRNNPQNLNRVLESLKEAFL